MQKTAKNLKKDREKDGRVVDGTDWTDRRRTTRNNKDDRRRTRRQTVKGRQTEKKTRNPTRGSWNQIIYLL